MLYRAFKRLNLKRLPTPLTMVESTLKASVTHTRTHLFCKPVVTAALNNQMPDFYGAMGVLTQRLHCRGSVVRSMNTG